MAGTTFPSFLKLEHQTDPATRTSFLRELDGTLGEANRRLESFSREAQRQVDAALAVNRNASGSLDLGVEEARAAAQATQARAIAAREVANATATAARETGDFSQQSRLAVAATQALAREEEQAARAALSHASALEQVQAVLNRNASGTQAVVAATRQGTTANRMMAESTRGMRVAMVQSGQQLQDIAISLYSGQRASVVFAQQLPQLAFALTSLEGSANKTLNTVGRFATFLAGPWGLAVGVAVGVLGSYVASLFTAGEETDKTAKKSRDFVDVMRDSKTSLEEAAEAAREYASAQEKGRQTTLATIEAEAAATAERLKSAASIRQKLQAELEALIARTNPAINTFVRDDGTVQEGKDNFLVQQLRQRLLENQQQIDKLGAASRQVVIKAADAIADVQSDPTARIKAGFDELRQGARETIKDVDALTARLADLNRQQKAAEDAARESTRTPRAARAERLPPVTGAEVARLIGAPITSGKRTPAQNRAAGGAANSYHLIGQAIDIPLTVNGRAITKESIRAALEPAGIVIKELLGPGDPGHSDHFHIAFDRARKGADQMAAATQRAEDDLRRFGESARTSIQSISDRFDDQPRLIDQSIAAVEKLDQTLADLRARNEGGRFDGDIAAAERAKVLAQTVVSRSIADQSREYDKQYQIQLLIIQGREREAFVMEQIAQAQRTYGEDLEEHEAEIRRIAELEFDRAEQMERIVEIQNAYLDATRSVRSEVEAILAGQGKFSNFGQIFKQLQGRVLAEQIFGDVFRDLDKWVKEKTGIGSSVDAMGDEVDRAGKAAGTFADVVLAAANRIATGQPAGGSSATSIANLATAAAPGAILSAMRGPANDNGGVDPATGDIVVVGRKSNTVNNLTPNEYFEELTKNLGKGLADALNGVFDTTFFSRFSGVLSGAASGFITGGAPGGAIGLLKGIKGLPEEISKALGDASKGAATGTAVAGIGKSLGLKLSTTGSQVGGAIGSFLPIPGGDIIGAIAGGIIGKLFGGTKSGRATIGGIDGGLGITSTGGNKGSFIKAASAGADSIVGGIERIADALGAEVNAAVGQVTIGIRDGKYRVNTSGTSLKTSKGATNFGKDGQAEAIAFATADLIRDGVLTGLRQTTLNILKKDGGDLENQIQKALDFEGVFNALKAIKDPVGAAIDALNKEFTKLRKTFTDANATTEEYAALEELYNIRRAEAVKQAGQQIIGSLKNFYDQLTIGDSGLSLRSRLESARAVYDPLAARVAAGDTTAYDDFSEAASTLLELQRQLYGSTGGYFELFDAIAGLTKSAIDAQTAISTASANSDSPFASQTSVPMNDNSAVVAAIDNQTTTIVAAIQAQTGIATATNDNIVTAAEALTQWLAAGGSARAWSFGNANF